MISIGVDPGENGGIAVVCGETAYTYKCPSTEKDMFELLKRIAQWSQKYTRQVWIEEVHAFPGRMIPCPFCRRPIRQPQGSVSVFTFGQNYGQWRMALTAVGLPWREVSPAKWQKRLGSLPSERLERKREIKRKMQARFPKVKVTLWNADALAIADVMNQTDVQETLHEIQSNAQSNPG